MYWAAANSSSENKSPNTHKQSKRMFIIFTHFSNFWVNHKLLLLEPVAQTDPNPNNFLRSETHITLKLFRQIGTDVYFKSSYMYYLVWICIFVQHNHIKLNSNQAPLYFKKWHSIKKFVYDTQQIFFFSFVHLMKFKKSSTSLASVFFAVYRSAFTENKHEGH
jgi:hypothetical protein